MNSSRPQSWCSTQAHQAPASLLLCSFHPPCSDCFCGFPGGIVSIRLMPCAWIHHHSLAFGGTQFTLISADKLLKRDQLSMQHRKIVVKPVEFKTGLPRQFDDVGHSCVSLLFQSATVRAHALASLVLRLLRSTLRARTSCNSSCPFLC